MADVTDVGSQDEFVQAIVSNEDVDITDDGAEELWRIWTHRYENGAADVLVAIPGWFAQNELGKNRPYFFAQIEHDEEDNKAILFSDARLINVNIVENQVWDDATMSRTVETLDISDDDDYIDESGKIWIPRSLMTIYAIED